VERIYDITGKVLVNNQISGKHWLLKLYCPEIAISIKPGQFVSIRLTRQTDPLFRRPFTIYRVHSEEGSISIIYQVVGKGTELLSAMTAEETLDVLGPLGNGFQLPENGEAIALVGRNTGIAPLVALAEEALLQEHKVYAFFSAADSGLFKITKSLNNRKCELLLYPDNGIWGCGIHLTKKMAQVLGQERISSLYTGGLCSFCASCGVEKFVHQYARATSIPAQISREQYMSCAVGACLGCVIPTFTGPEQEQVDYRKVCKDGPVFLSWEVVKNG